MTKKKHSENNILTILAFFGGASFLIIALAIAYYLVLYLPKKDVQKIELENKRAESQQSNKKMQYNTCLFQAESVQFDNWIRRCKANGYKIVEDENGQDNCTMPDYISKPVTDQYTADKEACLKIYQAN